MTDHLQQTTNSSLAQIDYRLGWRWLVQPNAHDRIFIAGFSPAETDFLHNAWSSICDFADSASDATIWLIDGSIALVPEAAGSDLRKVCVLGNRKSLSSWKDFFRNRFSGNYQPYALLPDRQPRIVVSIAPPHATKAGLELYSPGRRYAKVAVSASKTLANFGLYPLLQRRQIWIAEDNQSLSKEYFSIYLGNPEPNRKTVILPCDRSGAKGSIIKYGETAEAQSAIAVEANALVEMSKTVVGDNVPRLINFTDAGRNATLEQEYRPRIKYPHRQLDAAAIKFLSQLTSISPEERPLTKVLESLSTKPRKKPVSSYEITIMDQLWAEAKPGRVIMGHRAHGDFTPWNCSMTKKGFFVFDWEMSYKWAPALTDYLYYHMVPSLLLSKDPTTLALVKQKLFLQSCMFLKSMKIELNETILYWRLSIVQVLQRLELTPDLQSALIAEIKS